MTYPDDYINKVICGDCMDVMKQMPDECVDLVVTDPPYNVNINYDNYNDNMKWDEYYEYCEFVIRRLNELSNHRIVIILGSKILRGWWNLLPEAKLIVVKMGAISHNTENNLSLQYHPVLTTIKSNKRMSDLWEDIRWPGEGYFFNEQHYGHPAMTPLKLTQRLISLFSRNTGPIFDPFCGSGTTPVAAKTGGKDFIACDVSNKYCKIAEQRLAQQELFT